MKITRARTQATTLVCTLTLTLFVISCSGSEAGDPTRTTNPPARVLDLVATETALTIPEGSNREVSVALESQPEEAVTVAVSIHGGGGKLSIAMGAELTFATENWDSPQTVRVDSAQDDDSSHNWGILQFRHKGLLALEIPVTQQDDDPGAPPVDGVLMTVKDPSTVGATNHPVTAVIPLPFGAHLDTSGFAVEDLDGNAVPAQFEVLNRWWAKDNSIRHVTAYFEATVPPDGQSAYVFRASGTNPAPAQPVQVEEDSGTVTVTTGPLKFTVKRSGFNLFDEVWFDSDGNRSFSAAERMVAPDAVAGPVFTGRLAGDIQRAAERDDLKLVVEESGPMRAVIRASGLTSFESKTDHMHGFAVRIYAYAGKSHVKVDYQLQNSAKNKRVSWPLYFEDVSLMLTPSLEDPTLRLAPDDDTVWSGAPGHYLFQDSQSTSKVVAISGGATVSTGSTDVASSYGWADLSDSSRGVAIAIRNMAEMWPNGVEVDASGRVAVRLWPKWSAQWYDQQLSPTGLYWLDDMQHVYKEMLFYFHGPNASEQELRRVVHRFQFNPVPIVDKGWYQRTAVTLDLDGIIPSPELVERTDTKRPSYAARYFDPADVQYGFGWMNFCGNTSRKVSTISGGWPTSASGVIATERLDLWYQSEAFTISELNARPQWLAEYDHDEDFELIEPSQDPDGGRSWRAATTGHEPNPNIVEDYLPGTGFNGWHPRDNAHGWYYHFEEFFYLSANPWIRDWYEFVAEFRRSERSAPGRSGWSLLAADKFGLAMRGEAHSWAHSLQAFRVTGNMSLFRHLKDRLRDSVEANWNWRFGIFDETEESGFQTGFFGRSLISLMTEVEGFDQDVWNRAFHILWGTVDWNEHICHFSYYVDSRTFVPGENGASGSSQVFCDPIAWFILKTGRTEYEPLLREFILTSLTDSDFERRELTHWDQNGRWWLGRVTELLLSESTPSKTAPAAVTDLSVSVSGAMIRIEWTTPAGAQRIHPVWSTLPIATTWTRDADLRNPWACKPVANSLAAQPGSRQHLEFEVTGSGTYHVALFTFAADGAFSAISNVVQVEVP